MVQKTKKLKVEIKEPETEKKELELEKMEEAKENIRQKKLEVPKAAKNFSKTAKMSVYALVFLFPLFFLPWTSNVLDFNKQALLLFLVFVSLICWLASALISNRLEVNVSFLNLPVLVLLLFSGISTIFSLSRYGSFWGWPQVISSSFVSLLCLVALYFLIANLFKKNEIPFLFLTLFLSGFLSALFFLFQLFGKFIFPFDFARVSYFNTIGTVNSLAIYFSLLLIILLPLLFFVSRFFKIILGIIGLILLASLFLINFKTAWLVFLAGLAVLFVFGVVNLRKTGRSGFIVLTTTLLIIASFLLFFHFSLPGLPQIPTEASPSQGASLKILKSCSAKSLILGSGSGTFVYDWSKYKSQDVNQTAFWSVRFEQAASEILDRLITTGILGILAFFFLVFIFFKTAFGFLMKKMESRLPNRQEILNWHLVWGIFSGFTGLVAAFFLYPANLSIFLLFWLLIGCFALLEKEQKKIFDFNANSIGALVFSFFFILILVLGIGLFILYGQKYLAEIKYFQGLEAWQKGDSNLSIDNILQAANLNPKMDLYWRNLSQVYLLRLNEVLSGTDLSQQEKSNQAQVLVASSVNSAIQAATAEPNNAVNWDNRGFVYRNMMGVLGGADEWAIKSYQKAVELEPANPAIFTDLGKVYLAKSDLLRQQGQGNEKEITANLALAQNDFEQAVRLKSDFAPAHFQIAMIHIREGKTQEAIAKLEETQQVAPFDTGLAFQLGVLYYNADQFNLAKVQFERAVLLDPNYSNARYFLGLIYNKEGNENDAILQFEKIEQFNPDNQDVKKILANLKAGKPALEGVAATQPPVEEKNAEQLKK